MPTPIGALCSSLTERIPTRSRPRASAGARARRRASMSPIGSRTRRGAGRNWGELRRTIAVDAAAQSTRSARCCAVFGRPVAPLPSLPKSVGISPLPAGWRRGGATRMSLLIVYVALVIAGDVVAYLLGLVMEREVPAASLPAFLAMYF